MAHQYKRDSRVACKPGATKGAHFGSQVVEENQRAKILVTRLPPRERQKPEVRGYKASRKRKKAE